MKGKSGLLLAVFLVVLTGVSACDRGSKSPDLSLLGPSSAATSTVLAVGSSPCPKGGVRIDIGIDANNNGILDAPEVAKASPLCNDLLNVKKPNGVNSLIKIESEPTGTVHCPAGGLKVLSGTDANKNHVLDAAEIAYTEYICSGAPGSSSAAGITVEMAPLIMPSHQGKEKKKGIKSSSAKKTQSSSGASDKKQKKAKAKAAPQNVAEGRESSPESAALPKEESAEAKPSIVAEERDSPAESDALQKKAKGKGKTASVKSAKSAKSASASPAAPQGWTAVKVKSPELAKVLYKLDGRYIIVRFANLSDTSPVRFKYTVRWKGGQNGTWADDSTMEGISFRLKPLDKLDREIRTNAQEVKDVVIEIDVNETA